jgi:iron complex transport system ATP-binding protein
MTLLSVRGLACRAGSTPILDGVSFDVEPGELVALMGRNGAGKSTLLDVLAGLRRGHAGEVLLEGRPLPAWRAGDRARRIAHLPQSVAIDLPFTVEQIARMGRYPHADGWLESAHDHDVGTQALIRADCLELRERAIATLSGGERQRVLLAACLAQEPRLLLLDEPATFLDVDQQLRCFGLLRDEAARGAAVVAVIHDVNLALAFATRVIVLAERTIAFDVAISDARRRTDWLHCVSTRLRITPAPDGGAWVSYS